MLPEALTLGFLANVLSETFFSALRELTKGVDSSKSAKSKAFRLYKAANSLVKEIDSFQITLQAFLKELEAYLLNFRQDQIFAPRNGLTFLLQFEQLRQTLAEFSKALEDIGIPLSIHQLDLYESMILVSQDDFEYIFALDAVLGVMVEEDNTYSPYHIYPKGSVRFVPYKKHLPVLRQATEKLIENRKLIDESIMKMRLFLKEEFSFKESF